MRVLVLIIAAVILGACQGERLAQCDPANTPSLNCDQKPGSAPAPKNPPF
jgi:hypothetical protein